MSREELHLNTPDSILVITGRVEEPLLSIGEVDEELVVECRALAWW